MSRVPPRMRNLADRLMTHWEPTAPSASLSNKAASGNSSPTVSLSDFPVIEKLRPKLTTLMGGAGVHALLMRACALASKDIPWLRIIRIKPDGSLEGLDETGIQGDGKKILEGKTALLAEILGLLAAFIGETLTLQLMREVWPKLSLEGLDSGRGDNSEKQK